jgi:hypothetical protein
MGASSSRTSGHRFHFADPARCDALGRTIEAPVAGNVMALPASADFTTDIPERPDFPIEPVFVIAGSAGHLITPS